MTIESYRQWAKEEAEREYPKCNGANRIHPHVSLSAGYEAALLRMWPLVEALEKAVGAWEPLLADADLDAGSNPAWLTVHHAKSALSSLNLPKP